MEIFCSNVPEDATDKFLRKSFAPALRGLSISVYHCKKLRNKCARLTIADVNDAMRFLDKYGERKKNKENTAPATTNGSTAPHQSTINLACQLDGVASQRRERPLTNNTNQGSYGTGPVERLTIFSRPIYFRPSDHQPDELLLRSLEAEAAKPVRVPRGSVSSVQPPRPPKTFTISNFSCGSWDYKNGNPVFVSYFERTGMGVAHFGKRLLKLTLDTTSNLQHHIEFDYSSVSGPIYLNNSSDASSFTITAGIAPRLYEKSAITLFQSLGLGTKKRFDRDRVDSLGGAWNGVGATCFVYRIQLFQPTNIGRILALKKDRRIPDMALWRTPSIHPQLPYSTEMAVFLSKLTRVDMPFRVKFQLQALVCNGELQSTKVLQLFHPTKQLLERVGINQAVQVLQRLPRSIPFAGPEVQSDEFDIDTLVKSLFAAEENDEVVLDWTLLGDDTLHPHRALIHKALITPQGLYLVGPVEECKNRVLRRYAGFWDFFMRVEFAEETGDPMRYDPSASLDQLYQCRFKNILEEGIFVGGRKFDFLGFSHSSLRSQSCWFMAPFQNEKDGYVDAKKIIPLLGNFDNIPSPAKYAARLGQVFSDTMTSIAIPGEIVHKAPDVTRNERNFSDGCGTISASVMHKVLKEYALRAPVKPTIFQIRLAGAKGMLSLDPLLTVDEIVLRDSMDKFTVPEPWFVEICGAGIRPLPMYLNRPLIKILEDLGVPPEPFIEMQQNEVEAMRLNSRSPVLTASFLESTHLARPTHLPLLLRALGNLDIHYANDAFLRQVIEFSVLVKLRELKYRARIKVEDGVTVYGIMDETGTLKEGEVFVPLQYETGGRFVLIGERIVITRSPALHPGDVRWVNAVDVADDHPLQQLHNCVVFSQFGDRDLPSKLSGGDLDGDLYNVIWDLRLRTTFEFNAADYHRVPELTLGRPVERSDVIDHFLKFMQQDQLGRIATTHLAISDQSEYGTFDPQCMILAELHSSAVDFSKTGIPADISRIPKIKPYRPDFMAPSPRVNIAENIATLQGNEDHGEDEDDDDEEGIPGYKYYKSHKALGKLFRGIDEIAFLDELDSAIRPSDPNAPNTLLSLWTHVEHETALLVWNHQISTARDIKELYDDNLLDIMFEFSVTPWKGALTEVEVFIGSIIGKNDTQTKRSRENSVSMRDKYSNLVQEIVSQILNHAGGGNDALERAIACFAIAVEDEKAEKLRPATEKPQSLQSFKWIAAAICMQQVAKVQDSSKRQDLRAANYDITDDM